MYSTSAYAYSQRIQLTLNSTHHVLKSFQFLAHWPFGPLVEENTSPFSMLTQDFALAHRCIPVLGSCTNQIVLFDYYNVKIPSTNVYSDV